MTEMTEMKEVKAYDIKAIESFYGSIPAIFQKCFVCGEPTTRLMCGKFADPPENLRKLQDGGWEDPEAAAFEDCIREQSGCPVVLPVCVFHQNGSIRQ